MTTATDWDVRDTDTGELKRVTDVTSAAPDHAMELEQTHALAIRSAELSEQVGTLSADVLNLRAENRRLQAELDRRGWLPTTEQMRDADQRDIHSADDLTEREYNAGLYRPSELDDTDRDGMPLNPIGSSDTWPTWLGDVHHADATWERSVGNLRLWADDYAARPVERTVVEPVTVGYSYRQTEAALYAQMVVEAAEEHVASVYSELAPERIHAPDVAMVETSGHADRSDVQRMTRRVQGRPAIAPAEPATEVVDQGERVGGWRVWAVSAAIGIVGLAATIGALVVLA